MTRLILVGALALLVVVSWSALAAANAVPVSYADESTHAVDIPDPTPGPTPSGCSGLGLNNLIIGNGTINGTNANDLILGGLFNDTIDGRNGRDCIVASGGNDQINGNNGDDVIYGGSGNDAIDGRNGYDVCYGGAGTDTFANCEVVVQN